MDTGQPAVYYYFSHAILNKRPVLQINYVVWFSERRGPTVPWYEQGLLDGFTYRVTLGDTGIPMMIDLVHNTRKYMLIPYSDLEVLNIFNAKAIVKGSQRLEPLFLFPMGVPDIGAMRSPI